MNFFYRIFCVGLVLFLPALLFAQADQEKPKPVYLSPDGKLFVKSNQPIYLRLSTSKADNSPSFLLRSDSSVKEADVLPFEFEGDGRHTIRHMAYHRTPQKNKDNHLFNVYDDGKAPKTKISVTKAPWVYNGNVNIYGKPVSITLTTTDKGSGVFASYFALNSEAFSSYTSAIVLDQEMDYTLKFYAVDNVGNESKSRMRLYSLDFTPPTTTHKIIGGHTMVGSEDVLSPRSKISLKSRDLKAGVKEIRYRFKDKKGVYKKSLLTMKGLKDGVHSVVYAAEDRVENAEANVTFTFYLDSIPPVVSHDLLGDQYQKGKKTFVSGRTTVELTGTDNKAGLRRIRYFLPKAKAKTYNSPFGFPQRNGAYTYSFAASDNVLNVSKTIKNTVTIDVSAPKVRPKFSGEHYFSRKTHYVRLATEISLPTTDNLSGVQDVKYSVDGTSDISYTTPFLLSTEGEHSLSYSATDNVNNTSGEETIALFVDEKAPEIYTHFSVNPTVPDQDVYPLKSLLYPAATDKQSGIRDIFYSINGGAEIKFKNPLSFKRRMAYKVMIKAIDNVGNISTSEVEFSIK